MTKVCNRLSNRRRCLACLQPYSSRSYNLLNKYTLKVKDPEIDKELTRRRFERYSSLINPFAIVVALSFLAFLIEDLTYGSENVKSLCWLLPEWFAIVASVIGRHFKWQSTPLIMQLLPFLKILTITLSNWSLLPQWLKVQNPEYDEIETYFSLIVFNTFNYSSFI